MTIPEYSELVKNIRNDDKRSLEILFRTFYIRLRNYANTLVNSINDAEDITQEIFLKLWKNRDQLDESKSIETYLFVCTRNSCFNLLKHKRTECDYARLMALVYLDDTSAITPHESLIADDIEKDLYKGLDLLPEQCRKIFELNRFHGLKYHEIASRLNISIKTVETQMSRALIKLRFQLKRHTVSIHILLLYLVFNI